MSGLRGKFLCFGVLVVFMVGVMLPSGVVSAEGAFDEFGYNFRARIFMGTGESWAMGKYGITHDEAEAMMGIYAHDHLVMKWSKAWDDARFHGEPWTPEAWCINEWNGMMPDGSQETWRYVNIWVGPELEDSPYWREGGYAIWGEFEVIMSHGTYEGQHLWEALATPCGLGGS